MRPMCTTVQLAAGIEPTWEDDSSLSVKFGEITFFFAFDDLPDKTGGMVTEGQTPAIRFIVISNRIKNAKDFFLILGHELVHAGVLGYEGRRVAAFESRYGKVGADAFVELVSYKWEYSMLTKVPGISEGLRNAVTKLHIEYTILWHYITTERSCITE